jgi:hypothetical protein
VAQTVECLPSKHIALSSKPSTDKKQKPFSLILHTHVMIGPRSALLGQERVEATHGRLTPVILAIQEAEIRRMAAQNQPANSSQDPISKNPSQE